MQWFIQSTTTTVVQPHNPGSYDVVPLKYIFYVHDIQKRFLVAIPNNGNIQNNTTQLSLVSLTQPGNLIYWACEHVFHLQRALLDLFRYPEQEVWIAEKIQKGLYMYT